MATLFDGQDEPAMKVIGRRSWLVAYAEELKAHPPVSSCAGDDNAAQASRLRLAQKDITRAEAAARRLGCTIQLVPVPAKEPKREASER